MDSIVIEITEVVEEVVVTIIEGGGGGGGGGSMTRAEILATLGFPAGLTGMTIDTATNIMTVTVSSVTRKAYLVDMA